MSNDSGIRPRLKRTGRGALRQLRSGGLALVPLLVVSGAQAAPAPSDPTDALLSRPLALVVALALISLLPFAFMALTAFVKISTVLHITKSAIGAQSVPSTTVIMALSAALTMLAMAPVGSKITAGLEPILGGSTSATSDMVADVLEATREPIREFLITHAKREEAERFYLLARRLRPEPDRDAVTRQDFTVMIPAFMISQLIDAFALGFAIFLPFLVVDLIVGNVLLALGMQMMSPTQVSLPFKLLLFVAADGWSLLSQTLVLSYAAPL